MVDNERKIGRAGRAASKATELGIRTAVFTAETTYNIVKAVGIKAAEVVFSRPEKPKTETPSQVKPDMASGYYSLISLVTDEEPEKKGK